MVRYLIARSPSAYLVAIPKNAATIIQKSAPGPPAAIAVATPTIFPVPMVAESAVHRAPKLVTSPSPPSSFFTMNFSAFPRCLTCKRPNRVVNRIPVNRIRMISGSPQTTPSNHVIKLLICVNITLSSILLPERFTAFCVLRTPSALFFSEETLLSFFIFE